MTLVGWPVGLARPSKRWVCPSLLGVWVGFTSRRSWPFLLGVGVGPSFSVLGLALQVGLALASWGDGWPFLLRVGGLALPFRGGVGVGPPF